MRKGRKECVGKGEHLNYAETWRALYGFLLSPLIISNLLRSRIAKLLTIPKEIRLQFLWKGKLQT